jgi:hypothetical protein
LSNKDEDYEVSPRARADSNVSSDTVTDKSPSPAAPIPLKWHQRLLKYCKGKTREEEMREQQAALILEMNRATLDEQKKRERIQYLWRRVRMLVRTGMFIKGMKDASNEALAK